MPSESSESGVKAKASGIVGGIASVILFSQAGPVITAKEKVTEFLNFIVSVISSLTGNFVPPEIVLVLMTITAMYIIYRFLQSVLKIVVILGWIFIGILIGLHLFGVI